MAGEAEDANSRRLSIRVAHRRAVPSTRRLRDVPLAIGLPTLEELEEEFFGYVDVLLGRQEPPIDADVLTLMEVTNAYLSRAYEVDMMIHAAERNRDILRSNPYSKFRTGELRSFIELSRKAQELGSRRLTQAQMLAEAERTGNEFRIE
jgi:hypothetical protein